MEKKTNNKALKLIIAIIVILLIVAIIGGIFVLKDTNSSTGTEWGDIYYKYTKDISENLDRISEKEYDGTRVSYEYGLPDATHKDDVTAEFIDVDEDNTPEMILHYSNGNSDIKCISILHIVDNKVDLLTSDSGDEIELLYNIEKNEYNYYIHHIANNGLSEEYKSLKRNEQGYSDDYANFEKDEIETKFDQTFIKIDTLDNTFQIKPNMSEEEIKSEITTTVKDYNDINNIVTDDVKVATNQKVEEIKQKQETEKKVAEEKAKAEEEATKKKADEEMKKGLTVGKNTLKYGTYVLENSYEGFYGTIKLEPNGKCHIKSNIDVDYKNKKAVDTDATYSVRSDIVIDTPGIYQSGLEFAINGKKIQFIVLQNNSFSDQWHGYKYSGN